MADDDARLSGRLGLGDLERELAAAVADAIDDAANEHDEDPPELRRRDHRQDRARRAAQREPHRLGHGRRELAPELAGDVRGRRVRAGRAVGSNRLREPAGEIDAAAEGLLDRAKVAVEWLARGCRLRGRSGLEAAAQLPDPSGDHDQRVCELSGERGGIADEKLLRGFAHHALEVVAGRHHRPGRQCSTSHAACRFAGKSAPGLPRRSDSGRPASGSRSDDAVPLRLLPQGGARHSEHRRGARLRSTHPLEHLDDVPLLDVFEPQRLGAVSRRRRSPARRWVAPSAGPGLPRRSRRTR